LQNSFSLIAGDIGDGVDLALPTTTDKKRSLISKGHLSGVINIVDPDLNIESGLQP
jgi:hypothetical protein